MSRLNELREKITSWFLWFWVRQYRISYLVIFWILVLWTVSLMNIPKESSPSIEFWMISITTVYPWTNPNDIDSLITDKIYKEVKDISWIDEITSSSSLWFSMISITLKTWADSKSIVNEVRNNVNRIVLPTDAKTPVITEIDTDTKQAFSIYVYWKNKNTSNNIIIEKANSLKEKLEKLWTVESVNFANWSIQANVSSSSTNSNEYNIEILVSPEKMKNSGLTIDTISSTIKSWNKDIPIWNFIVWDKKYDFRIEWKYGDAIDMLDIPLQLNNWNFIKLWDIASIERVYKDKSKNIIWNKKIDGLSYISLVVNKSDWTSIFAVSKEAKKVVEEIFSTEELKDFSYVYWNDLADTIIDDYIWLSHEALITLILVFISMYLFVWFKDSLFATITLPLAFLSTFIVLSYWWFSLNFLTNFSLILSFWIAIDTIIVIVQAASAKIRVWYDPETAIMLALREYSIPIIAWVLSTIVVFIPMMFLPGLMWKFLAYIPITIFWVLACWLVLALTVNSALYLLFVKKQKFYVSDKNAIEYATEEEKELLLLEREWKTEMSVWKIPMRVKVIHNITLKYKKLLWIFLKNNFLRRTAIFTPVVLLVLSFIFLAPRVWFDLFPSADNNFMTVTIEGENWLKTEKMYEKISDISDYLSKYDEIKYYTVSINDNSALVSLQLLKSWERDDLWLKSVFDLEKFISKDFLVYEEKWLKVTTDVLKSWPPWAKSVWLKLVAEKSEQLPELIDVAKDFEKNLKLIPWTKSSELSSKDTPWQFVFVLKKEVLWNYNIPPVLVYGHIMQMMNWVNVGSVEDNWTDMDIYIKQSNFREEINVEDIINSTFSYMWKSYQIGNFVEYNTKNSIASISREDWKIIISVQADVEKWIDTVTTQNKFEEFANSYDFPNWISYLVWGENEANKELIVAVLSSFFIAIIIIFAILTLQFNSYSQPLIILYSVIMSLPFVMLWLLLTWNKFSLSFWIWFIAFTWIAVNHWIILVDAININLKKWMESFTALVEAWSSRLEPMTLTTLTTVLWIFPIALKDPFWSWMGFTIIFGIIAASTITLFILKWVYYEIYLNSNKIKK